MPRVNLVPNDISAKFPIDRVHVRKFDHYRNNMFPKSTGVAAHKLDASLGLDFSVYQAMNHVGQRQTIKMLDAS
jgi:hypothetical protein